MPVESRVGTHAELPALARLHAQCFSDPWDEAFLGQLLAQRGSYFILARQRGGPVGFVIARTVVDEAEIHSLGVAPDRRKRGIGKTLMRLAAEHALTQGAAAIFLEVSASNGAALALYARLGFSEVGRRPGYYPASPAGARDAVVLRRALPL